MTKKTDGYFQIDLPGGTRIRLAVDDHASKDAKVHLVVEHSAKKLAFNYDGSLPAGKRIKVGDGRFVPGKASARTYVTGGKTKIVKRQSASLGSNMLVFDDPETSSVAKGLIRRGGGPGDPKH